MHVSAYRPEIGVMVHERLVLFFGLEADQHLPPSPRGATNRPIHLSYISLGSCLITHASQGFRSRQLRIRCPGRAGASSPCSCHWCSQSCALVDETANNYSLGSVLGTA